MTDIVERLRGHPGEGQTVTQQFRNMVEQRHEAADEIERLTAIEQAAEKAYRYHMLGYKDPQEFNANTMLDLMNELGAALKPKPDLRALLPELAVIRQVMKEPKP